MYDKSGESEAIWVWSGKYLGTEDELVKYALLVTDSVRSILSMLLLGDLGSGHIGPRKQVHLRAFSSTKHTSYILNSCYTLLIEIKIPAVIVIMHDTWVMK